MMFYSDNTSVISYERRTYRTFLRFYDKMIVLERKGDNVPVGVLAGMVTGSGGVLHHGSRRGNVYVLHHLRLAHVSGYV